MKAIRHVAFCCLLCLGLAAAVDPGPQMVRAPASRPAPVTAVKGRGAP